MLYMLDSANIEEIRKACDFFQSQVLLPIRQ